MFSFMEVSGLEASATTNLRKVRNLRGEQKQLENCAIDSDSLVSKVSQTLSFMCRVGRDT